MGARGTDDKLGAAIDRRRLLKRALGAVAAFTGIGLIGRTAPVAASPGSKLLLSDFGATGNGSSDDTAAIQAALNAARSGVTVLGQPGAVYLISNTLSFPTDGVTLDLGGGAVRIGARRALWSALQTNDTMFSTNGRNRVRITNGRILSALSSYGGGATPYRIHVDGGQGCQIDHLAAACDGSALVYVWGQQHSIASNAIDEGAISGAGTSNVVVKGNTLTNSPYDAISFTGYQGAPVTGTQYLNNVISGYGRLAIEEHSPDGAAYCVGSTFIGNTISSPSPSNMSGTGISAISTSATIANNAITDAAGWAIEATGLGTTVSGNRISWSQISRAALESTAIVINTSLPTDISPVLVSGNTITGGATGIQLFGNAFYCPVTISANQLTNTISQGIQLAPAARTGLISVTNNVVSFSQQPQSAITRYGIVPATGAQLKGNQITYTTTSYRPGTYDIPYNFTGDNVTMIDNLANGGGRTDNYIGSLDLGGAWTGWTLTNNTFSNGAPAYTTGLVAPTLSGNTGLVTA